MKTFTFKICCITSILLLWVGTAKNGLGQTFSQWSGTVPTANNSYTFGATGSYSNPYLISTAADLAQLAANVNAGNSYRGEYFKQMVDIDLNNIEWIPIGGDSSTTILFAGNYDGDNHTIKNLKITQEYDFGAGLFGRIVADTIKNIILDSVNIVSTAIYSYHASYNRVYFGVGAAIGSADSCVIEYIQVQSGSVTHATASAYNFIGGIVGAIPESNASVIVRYCTNGANISNHTNVRQRSAGIVGSGGGGSTITGCVNIGTISGDGINAGITTVVGPSVTNCLNAGIIIGSRANREDGISESPQIINCLNVNSTINTTTGTPAPIGSQTSRSSNNYYDIQMQVAAIATNVSGTVGKQTSELTGNALQGILDTNWTFSDGLYPVPTRVAHTDVAKVAAVPVYLYSGENTNWDSIVNVSSLFSLADTSYNNTPVVWTNAKTDTNTAVLKISNAEGSILARGADTLFCTLNSAQKEIYIHPNPIEIWTVENWDSLVAIVNAKGGSYTYRVGGTGDSVVVPIHRHASKQQIKIMADLNFEDEENRERVPLGNDSLTGDTATTTYLDNYFEGIIEGNNHTFTDAYYYLSGGTSVRGTGLIGISGNASIENLHFNYIFEETSGLSNHHVGAFVGVGLSEHTLTIRNCNIYALNIGGSGSTGGIVGKALGNALIENCAVYGYIWGNSNSISGGIVGYASGGVLIENCCSTGDFKGMCCGGIANTSSDTTNKIIQNNLSSALVIGTHVGGGIIGDGAGTLRYNLFVGQVSGEHVSSIGNLNQPTNVTSNFYEMQLCPLPGLNEGQETQGSLGLIGHRLLGSCGYLGTTNWTYTEGLYPVPTAIKDTEAAKIARTPVVQLITSESLLDDEYYVLDNWRDDCDDERPLYAYQTANNAKYPIRLNKNEGVRWILSSAFDPFSKIDSTADYYLCTPKRTLTSRDIDVYGSSGSAYKKIQFVIPAAQVIKASDSSTLMNTGVDVVVHHGGQITDTNSTLALGSGKTLEYIRTFPTQPDSGESEETYVNLALPFEPAAISVDNFDDMVCYIIRPSGRRADGTAVDGHFQMKILRTASVDSNKLVGNAFSLRWDNRIYTNTGALMPLKGVPLHIKFEGSYYANRPIRFHSAAGASINTSFSKAKIGNDAFPNGTYYFYPNATMKKQSLGVNEPAFIWDSTTGYFEWLYPASGTAHSIPAFECYIQANGANDATPQYHETE